MGLKKILIPIAVILLLGGIIFVAVYFSTRGSGISRNLGRFEERELHSYNWCGNRKVIHLTFDDGPDITHTPALLEDLRRHNVKATFFMSPAVNGEPTAQQCALVEQVLEHGHSVQSHSYDHTNFQDKDAVEIRDNLETNRVWLESCRGGNRLKLSQFRPPFGALDVERAKFVSDLGYTIASWNIESADYTGADANTVFNTILTAMDGLPKDSSATIIMHDKHYFAGGTRGLLDQLVPFFRDQRGYKFVSADDCFNNCNNKIASLCKNPTRVWPGAFDTIY